MGASAVDVLIETLSTTDNVAVAVAAVNAIASAGDERAISVLTALTQDESVDSYVRESAVSALPRLDQVLNYKRSHI